MHKLLKRQLKRIRLKPGTLPTESQWELLLEMIDRTYTQSDQDRYLMERSLDQSSKEMRTLYENLQASSEQQIAMVAKKLQSILDSVDDAIIIFRPQGKIESFNQGAEMIFERSAEETVGRSVDMLFPRAAPIHMPKFYEQGQRETLGVRASGEQFPIDLAISEYLIDGEPGYIAIARDITARQFAQQEMQAAKEAAEAANKSKSAFLANMSHEIRTPLNAIIGLAGLMIDTPLNPEQLDFMETIRNSGDSLLTILNDILDFSKIEAEQMDLEHHPLSLEQLIEDTVDLLGAKAADKGLELLNALDPALPQEVYGDVTRLRQILVNLVSNAIKFTSSGHVKIELTNLTPDQTERVRLRFAISDTGIGIPKDRLERLFKSFSQVDASVTRKFGGTGLGLAICKQLVELMDGQITVDSTVGRGSTFTLEIEFDVESSSQIENALRFKGRKALIVDPYSHSRKIICEALNNQGIKTKTASSLAKVTGKELNKVDMILICLSEFEELKRFTAVDLQTKTVIKMVPYHFRHRQTPAFDIQELIVRKPLKRSALYNVIQLGLDLKTGTEIGDGNKAADYESGELKIPALAEIMPLRILLVDDNIVNQKVGINMLKRFGYRADIASNGVEALAAVRRQTYDLVLMDIQMPEMDGYQATKKIRKKLPPDEQPIIIAMTADDDLADRDKVAKAKLDGYISKPVRLNELKEAIQAAKPPINLT